MLVAAVGTVLLLPLWPHAPAPAAAAVAEGTATDVAAAAVAEGTATTATVVAAAAAEAAGDAAAPVVHQSAACDASASGGCSLCSTPSPRDLMHQCCYGGCAP